MTVGGDRKSKAQNGLLIKGDTAETIAKEHNIGRNTVKRAEKFVEPFGKCGKNHVVFPSLICKSVALLYNRNGEKAIGNAKKIHKGRRGGS